jgi:hypothetical protein
MRRGRLGHMIPLHRVDRCLRGMIRGRKTRRGAALPSAYAGGCAQSLCHIPTPVPFWQDSGRRIDPRPFHRHVGTARLLEPVRSRQQISGHRTEGPGRLQRLWPLSIRDEAGHHGLFVNIEPTAMRIHYVHHPPPEVATPHGMLVWCRISAACFLDEERQTVVPPNIQALLLAG